MAYATQEEVKAWLESHQPKVDLTTEETDEVRQLIGHAGLGHLISLLLASRMAQYAILAGLPLESEALRARASVTQGTIKGIDIIRDTLLEMAVPAQAEEGANGNG